jgi:hypothetical protein
MERTMTMAKAIQNIPLSSLFADPDLRAAFWRAEREDGQTYAVPADRPRILTGGAVAVRELVEA